MKEDTRKSKAREEETRKKGKVKKLRTDNKEKLRKLAKDANCCTKFRIRFSVPCFIPSSTRNNSKRLWQQL